MRKPCRAVVVTFAAALSGASLGCGGSQEPTTSPSAAGAETSGSARASESPPTANPPPPEVVLRNPPPQDPPPPPACPPLDAMREGNACAPEGQRCYEREGCGLNRYVCQTGAWRAMHTFCNPPRR